MSAPVAPARGVVETWHPGWLGIVLGTSGVALASLVDPVGSTTADQVLGAVLAAAATVLLVVLAVPYVQRMRRHRHAVLADLSHPGIGAMFGTVPAATLIVGVTLAQLGVVGWLPAGVAWIAALLTVLGVAGALVVGVEFFSRVVAAEQVPVGALNGAWFIPLVVLVLVPSAVARILLLQPSWATSTAVAASAASWGAGMLLFLLLAPVLAWRLLTGPPPVPAQAAGWWIWLAPAGAGGLGAIALSRMAGVVAPGGSAPALTTAGLLAATALWGFGVWWALLAGRVLRTVATTHGGLGFHLGSWGFVFPTAALAALTIELGRSWSSPVLSVVGALLWVAALAVWGRLAFQTVKGLRDRTLLER